MVGEKISSYGGQVKTTFYQGWNNLVKMTSVQIARWGLFSQRRSAVFVLGDEWLFCQEGK